MKQVDSPTLNPNLLESINVDPDLRKTLLDSELKFAPSSQVYQYFSHSPS